MSYQEKKNIVSLLGTLLIFGCYSVYVLREQPDWSLAGTETFTFWAAAILILIPVSVAAKIVLYILFNIGYRIVMKEAEPSFTDELDQLIQLRSTRMSHYVFVFGFLLAMVALVLGMPASAMFVILFFSGFVSEVAGIATELVLYRKGV